MYGTLDAADRWGEHYALSLINAELTRETASPCHFYHVGKDIWILVRGDDFVVVARQSGREYAEATLRIQYEVKVDIAGPEPQDPKEISRFWGVSSLTLIKASCMSPTQATWKRHS